jgi:phosphoglycerol transferase MdoB-like AlkP superfamily enzyme
VLYFAQTLKNKKVTYSVEKTREYYDLMADYLGVQQPDKQALNFKREFPQPGPLAAKRPNIILVYLESFAAYKTTTFGNPLDPTPNFDALARNGLLFTRYYTPHTGTARSVFTGITGIPDIEMHRTSSRNPLVVDQHTLVNAFKDYNKYYFLGGSANWGNIRGILSHNIPGLDIHEEGSYESPRIDVWGISDLNLFEEANKVFKKQDKPFFAIIQTSGNHRPYTIP